MVLTKRATDKDENEYREIPDGFVGRYVIGEPKLRKMDGKFGPYWLVDFPLELTEAERKRLIDTHGEPPEGMRQSWRPSFGGYSCGWTLKPKRDGSWLVVDFLAAAFGARHARKFRDWIAAGACPPERDEYTEEANVAIIESWLKWVEGLEVYGSIHHKTDDRGLKARFTNPMPIGSLPGQPEAAYQEQAAAKLRGMMDESGSEPTETTEPTDAAGAATPANGQPVAVDPTKLTPEQLARFNELFGAPAGAA